MDWGVVSWIVAVAVLLAAAGYLWRVLGAAARRHERRLQYLRGRRSTRPQKLSTGSVPLTPGMTRDEAALVRASAERAARHDWIAGQRAEANPHRRGTPEGVLWLATYHLTLHELDESPAERAQQGGNQR